MKKMKKIIFIVLFVFTLALVGCGHEHTFVSDWSSDAENHWHLCDAEDCEEKSEFSAHTFGEWQVTVEATETSKGTRVKTCTVCSYEVSEVINELTHVHSMKHVEAKEANCTTEGNIEHYHCDACGKNYSDEAGTNELEKVVMAKTSHKLVLVPQNDATCISEGNVEYYHCELCENNFSDQNAEKQLESVTLSKEEHNLTHYEAVEPSYTKEGNVEYYHCDKCDKNYSDENCTNVLETVVVPMKTLVYGTESQPLSVATAAEEIAKLSDNESSLELGYVSGVVVSSGSYYNTKNKYYSINIADSNDASKVIVIYSPQFSESVDGIYVGDTIVVSGKYMKYVKDTTVKLELGSSVTILSSTHPSTINLGTEEAPLTVSQGYDIADKLIESAYSFNRGFVKGFILKIDGKNVTIGDAKDATKTLVVYNGKQDDSYTKDMEVGDYVVVNAYYQKYVYNNNVTLELSSSPVFYLDHEHNFTVTTPQVNPTLTETGTAAYTHCSVCGYESGGEEIPVLSDINVWVKTTVAPTYNEKGTFTFTSEKYGTIKVDGDPKLVAPYDNKTYGVVEFDADDRTNRVISMGTSWNKAFVTLDANGCGVGKAFPFMGYTTIKMVDATTGQVLITLYSFKDITEEEAKELKKQGIYVKETEVTVTDTDDSSWSYGEEKTEITYQTIDNENKDEYQGFVDFETGVIVRTRKSNFDDVLIYTPYTTDGKDYATSTTKAFELKDGKASAWSDELNKSMAISYKVNDAVKSIFIHKDTVTFNVSFFDFDGNEVLAQNAYKAANLTVKVNDTIVKQFVKKGDILVLADGLQGEYINGEEKLVLDGANGLSYTFAKDGSTSTAKGTYQNDPLAAIIDNVYYALTLNAENKTFTLTKDNATITYVNGTETSTEIVNKVIPFALKALTKENQTLIGWFLDDMFTKPVVLDENGMYSVNTDVTLYAKWADNISISFVDVVNGVISATPQVVTAAVNTSLNNYLPEYDVDEEKWIYFIGWFLQADCSDENAITDFDIELTEETDGTVLYAKWEKLPAYYGSYFGVNVYGDSSKASSVKKISFAKDGKVTGQFSGIVESYENGIITIKKENNSKVYLWFNEETGTIATRYNGSTTLEIGYDIDMYVRNTTNEKAPIVENTGLSFYKGKYSTYKHTRLVTVNSENGVKTILLKDNAVYNVTEIADAFGNELTVSQVLTATTLIVKNNDTVLLSIGTSDASFKAAKEIVLLDEYYGEYINGEQTIKLNGVGGILVNEYEGTYELNGDHFDVYLKEEDDKEAYYSLILTADSYVLTKELATVNFSSTQTSVDSFIANVNISFELPVLENTTTHVFRGWYISADFDGEPITSYTAKSNSTVTLYAKWLEKATLTINYNNNNETETTAIEYGKGEIVEISTPSYTKHKFVKWVDNNGQDFVSGTIIEDNITITAVWEEAPVYNNDYYLTIFTGNSKNGETTNPDDRTPIVSIDPEGFASNPKSWPFNGGDIEIKNYNVLTGELLFVIKKATPEEYKGFVDKKSGIMIISNTKNTATAEADMVGVWMLQPFEKSINAKSNMKSSYWNSGKTRVISYTFGDETYNIFINNNQVYFGVSFKDEEGNPVSANEAYIAVNVNVIAQDNSVIASFGFNGTTMVAPDEFKGSYTNGANSVVLDGIQTIKITDSNFALENAKGTYVVVEENDAKFVGAFVNDQYFEIVFNEGAYSVSKPMVDFTADLDGGKDVASTIQLNKAIEIELPIPTKQGYFFKGWLIDDATTPVYKVVPTKAASIKAVWAEEVILHVVYNTIENVSLRNDEEYRFGKGDKIVFDYPTTTINPYNELYGYLLEGWTKDGQNYTLGTITENMTINAVWNEEASIFYGSYVGTEFWGNATDSNGHILYGGTSKTYSVRVNGYCSGSKSGTIKYDETKNHYSFNSGYMVYDAKNDIIVFNDSSNKTEKIDQDVHILVKGYDKCSADKNNTSTWDEGVTKVIELELELDSKVTKMIVFIYNNQVYGNVALESTDGAVTAGTIYNMSNVTVKNSEGQVIASFIKNDKGTFVAA